MVMVVTTVSLVLGTSSVATGESDGRRETSLLVFVLRRVGSGGTGAGAGVVVMVMMVRGLAKGLGI
jgi:hypothetical protein